jgi:hypothetical protein
MRQLTTAESLSLAKLLEMESNSLTIARASQIAISDEQLKSLVKSEITSSEARVMGLQQFIAENNLLANVQSQSTTQQKEAY